MMTCDECLEQLFELIEREAEEPEVVREILARCPECRALFDEMKAALADVSRLPMEEPPSDIDELVLQAARERSTRVATRSRTRWYRSPQWAVAAAALLAVGIGVWAIPRGERVVMEDAADVPARGGAEETALLAEESPTQERVELADRSPGTATAAERGFQPAVEPRSVAQAAKTPEKKRAVAPVPRGEHREASEAMERAELAPAPRAPSSGVSFEIAGADSAAEGGPGKEHDTRVASPECEARLAKLARDQAAGVEANIDAEEALAIGRCYRDAGHVTEARSWLERAASDPKTRRRAMRALKALPPP